MSASFRSHTFLEGGQGATTFPVWERKSRTAVLEVPGANGDIIQKFGRKSDTIALLATCTAAELAALSGDVGQTGSLVIAYDTRQAYLDSISSPHEVLADHDLFVITLNFIG